MEPVDPAIHHQLVPAEEPAEPRLAPSLVIATSNGNLIRFMQDLAMDHGWDLRACLTGTEVKEALVAKPARLVVIDVFIDENGGFDLRGEIRLKTNQQIAPILLVAPGCSDEVELAERLEISRARFEARQIQEQDFALQLAALMSDSPETLAVREHFRFSTFIHVSGEVCHALNQPLTSLICNLELAMNSTMEDSLRQRLKTTHDSALKMMQIIQRFQLSKRHEESDHVIPIFLLARSTATDTP